VVLCKNAHVSLHHMWAPFIYSAQSQSGPVSHSMPPHWRSSCLAYAQLSRQAQHQWHHMQVSAHGDEHGPTSPSGTILPPMARGLSMNPERRVTTWAHQCISLCTLAAAWLLTCDASLCMGTTGAIPKQPSESPRSMSSPRSNPSYTDSLTSCRQGAACMCSIYLKPNVNANPTLSTLSLLCIGGAQANRHTCSQVGWQHQQHLLAQG